MSERAYVVYPERAIFENPAADVSPKVFINEPGTVSFGTIDFPMHYIRALHRHKTWELIILDNSSEGPGYVFFDDLWWRVLPGSGVFVPKGLSHAWSSGANRFKMLWVYGGSRKEAGRILDVPEGTMQPISADEEKKARIWSPAVAV